MTMTATRNALRCVVNVVLSSSMLSVGVAAAKTATRTPDELVCLPLVVDSEGYAILAGILGSLVITGLYVAWVRREGRRRQRQASLEALHDAEGTMEEGPHHAEERGPLEDAGAGGAAVDEDGEVGRIQRRMPEGDYNNNNNNNSNHYDQPPPPPPPTAPPPQQHYAVVDAPPTPPPR